MVFLDPRETDAVHCIANAIRLSEARAYDQALETCLEGILSLPAYLDFHAFLYGIGLRRKVAGGKPAGLLVRLRIPPRDPVARLVHVERLWSFDLMWNPARWFAVKRCAARLAKQESAMVPVGDWLQHLAQQG